MYVLRLNIHIKTKKIFGPLKYLVFTQYFHRDTIDVKEIATSIDVDSLTVIEQ